jgi:osmotically-inducible protein OsmY
MLGYIAAALVGALAMYFLDPERGTYRRGVTRDRISGSAEAYGVAQKLTHLDADEPPASDATLAQKVMTELFRDEEIPKGDINIDAARGVVFLRGEIERPDMIEHIESRVRRIDGVRDVRNLLHQPGTPAPDSAARR